MLQSWAEAVLAVCRTLPDADLTRDVEQQASSAAQPLFRQSVEAYQQVLLLVHTAADLQNVPFCVDIAPLYRQVKNASSYNTAARAA